MDLRQAPVHFVGVRHVDLNSLIPSFSSTIFRLLSAIAFITAMHVGFGDLFGFFLFSFFFVLNPNLFFPVFPM